MAWSRRWRWRSRSGRHPRAAPAPTPVWIDTDPAIGEPERDVDDGLALVQAFHSPELDIRGVSVVFGNAELDRGLPIARRLVTDYGPPGLRVFKGAAKASDLSTGDRGEPRAGGGAAHGTADHPRAWPGDQRRDGPVEASRARVARDPRHRRRRPPAGTALHDRHHQSGRPSRLQLRAGSARLSGAARLERRAGARAVRDLVEDLARRSRPRSAGVIVIGRGAGARGAGPRVAARCGRRLFGVDGFNPFDTLAVAYAISPDGFACEPLQARIETLADDVTKPACRG